MQAPGPRCSAAVTTEPFAQAESSLVAMAMELAKNGAQDLKEDLKGKERTTMAAFHWMMWKEIHQCK